MPAKTTQTQFIEKSRMIYGDKYDYSYVEYINTNQTVEIVCREHGPFLITPKNHLKGQQCKFCANIQKSTNMKLTTEQFIERAKRVHGELYDYSSVEYIDNHTPITIMCKEHGPFKQIPTNHTHRKSKCPICSKRYSNTKMFIEKATLFHGNTYEYTKVNYMTAKIPVTIICKTHGEFKQTPNTHIHGKSGCPVCNHSKGELEIKKFLDISKIEYISQHKIWIGDSKYPYRLDFFVPTLNVAVEYDGFQHFECPDTKLFTQEMFEKIKLRDARKNEYCKRNNIRLIRIPYKKFSQIHNILRKEFKLLL